MLGMNKRMLQLAEQAWDATAVSPEFGHPVSFAEKLSELIIQECIDTVHKRYMGDNNREDREVLRCVSELKNRFGVKE
jgi:hypothetical protein